MTTTELHIALNECGFYRTGTGGGCDAFIRMFNDKNAGCDPLCVFEDCPDAYIMMTQSEDPSAPEGNEDVYIGFYAENGATLTWTATAEDALKFARSLTYENRV
jgi:hypothetical protein